jgi:putative hydrolase of the HAD superfamily
MSPRLRAVVFDLDDTLYPERAYMASGLKAVAEWIAPQLQKASQAVLAEMERIVDREPLGKTFDTWLLEQGLSGEWREPMIETYRTHRPRIDLFPDAARALAKLARLAKLGMVTEGEGRAQRAKLAALGLEGIFEAVVILGREERDQWKPSPEPFRRVLSQLKLPGELAVYIGDNPRKDFRGARSLGMRTVRVRRPQGLYAAVEPASAEDVADLELIDLDGLEEALALDGRRAG